MKGYIKKLLREGLLYESLITEGVASEFTTDSKYNGFNDNIYYRTTVNGIKYEVAFRHSPKSNEKTFYGEYTGMFNTLGGNFDERLGKDIKHFNDVMTTIGEIIKDAVKNFKIRSLKFSGEADKDRDKDISDFDLLLGNAYTTRTKYYVRFFGNLFPSAEIKMLPNNIVKINLVSAMPEYFEEDNYKLDKIYNLIDGLTELFKDPEPDPNGFEMDGLNTDNYTIKYYGYPLETFVEMEFFLSYNISNGFSVDLTIDGEDIDTDINGDKISYHELFEIITNLVDSYREKFTDNNSGESIDTSNNKEEDLKIIINALNSFGKGDDVSEFVSISKNGEIHGSITLIKKNVPDLLYNIKISNVGQSYKLEHGISEWTGDVNDIDYKWFKPIIFDDVKDLERYILSGL